jgi:hypothetical protein
VTRWGKDVSQSTTVEWPLTQLRQSVSGSALCSRAQGLCVVLGRAALVAGCTRKATATTEAAKKEPGSTSDICYAGVERWEAPWCESAAGALANMREQARRLLAGAAIVTEES